jgi:hypothetical protein
VPLERLGKEIQVAIHLAMVAAAFRLVAAVAQARRVLHGQAELHSTVTAALELNGLLAQALSTQAAADRAAILVPLHCLRLRVEPGAAGLAEKGRLELRERLTLEAVAVAALIPGETMLVALVATALSLSVTPTPMQTQLPQQARPRSPTRADTRFTPSPAAGALPSNGKLRAA